MRHVWDCGAVGCQGADVQHALDRQRPVALTTILTTLDRLREKGIVRREREGKAYRYWPMLSEEQLQERIVTGVMDRLIAQFPKAVAAYFAQQGLAGQETDAAGLSDLARRVEAINSVQQGEDRQRSQDEPEEENSDGR
jgi:predicted transcriptional regulator